MTSRTHPRPAPATLPGTNRTRLTALAAGIALLLAGSAATHAVGPIDRMAIGPSAGWMDGGDSNGDVGWGASGLLLFTPNIGLASDIHWFTSLNTDAGEIEAMPVTASLQYRRPGEGITLFVGGGVGYYFMDYSASAVSLFGPQIGLALEDAGFSFETEIDDELAYHAQLGTEISLMERLTAQIEVRYTWLEAEARFASNQAIVVPTEQGLVAIAAAGVEELDLSGVGIYISLRYSF